MLLAGLPLKFLLLLDVVQDLVAHQFLVSGIETEVEGDSNVGLLGGIDMGVNDLARRIHRHRNLGLQGYSEPEDSMSSEHSGVFRPDDQTHSAAAQVGEISGEFRPHRRQQQS